MTLSPEVALEPGAYDPPLLPAEGKALVEIVFDE
jgi:hypothetical protein